jgi:hypothetical protein
MITPDGTVYVDNTTLRAVQACESEAALRYVLGYGMPGDQHPLECGTAIHEVLADYFRGKPASYCLRKYELLYRGYAEEAGLEQSDNPMARLGWQNTSLILDEWFATHPLRGFPFRVHPNMVEVGFEYPLDDECVCGHREAKHDAQRGCAYRGRCGCTAYRPAFVLWGRLDAIVQSEHDRALYVLDHKTTGRISPYWVEKFRNDSQMCGYVWAAQKTLGQPVTGIYINAIELSKLPDDPVRKCRAHGTVYAECGRHHMRSELLIFTRSPDQLEEWRLTALKLARQYRDLLRSIPDLRTALTKTRMEGTFTGACGFCTFAPFCQAGRPLQYADTMLIQAPWRPYEK